MAFRLTDITIRTRLYVLVALATVTTALILGLAAYLLRTYRVGGERHEPIRVKRDVRTQVAPPTLYMADFYITLQEMESARPEDVAGLLEQLDGHVKRYEADLESAVARLDAAKLRRKLEGDVNRSAQELIRAARADFLPLLGKAKQPEVSAKLRERLLPLFREHRRTAVEFDRMLEEEMVRAEADVTAEARAWLLVLAAVSAVSIVTGGAVGWVTARGIVRGTAVLNERVREMASGAADLSARIPIESKDELGQLADGINAVLFRIQSIVSKVRESSLQLLATASEIAATARSQDSTVQGLSSSTSQVAAAVREITATSKELASTMNEVNGRASQAAGLAAAGRSRLGGMEQTMSQLVQSTAGISAKLSTIREKADSINVVVTTITKVADQTNLLSINAAIEAEKAGEYGRGFLVVAREIRRLADQTAVATLDIESMVRHMQEAVTTGVMQMDKFSDEVRSGVGKVAEINGQTGQIIDQVHGLTDRFSHVNEGMRNQTIGAEQINEAMVSMTGNIRQTAGALEDLNRATGLMRASVEALNAEIEQFKT